MRFPAWVLPLCAQHGCTPPGSGATIHAVNRGEITLVDAAARERFPAARSGCILSSSEAANHCDEKLASFTAASQHKRFIVATKQIAGASPTGSGIESPEVSPRGTGSA